jgi:biopolymer transport protein ExbB
MEYLIKIVSTSGTVGVLIVVIGVVALVMVIERIIAYLRASRNMKEFQTEFDSYADSGNWTQAQKLCNEQRSDLAALGRLIFAHGHRGPASLRSVLNNHVDSVALPGLRTRLRELAMIAKVAPMFGLFGTVQGMIEAFGKIAGAKDSGVNPKDLADSIGLALGTTFLGLLVAMPIVFALSLLQSKIEQFAIDLEKYTERCVDQVAKNPVPPPTQK